MDEIDSIMSARGGSEHEASRRLKTEFLVQFDGVSSNPDAKILVLAATNRPFDLDEAALRRLTRRIYLPLPDIPARISLLKSFLKTTPCSITEEEYESLGELLQGYSAADTMTLVREAAMIPVRSLPTEELL